MLNHGFFGYQFVLVIHSCTVPQLHRSCVPRSKVRCARLDRDQSEHSAGILGLQSQMPLDILESLDLIISSCAFIEAYLIYIVSYLIFIFLVCLQPPLSFARPESNGDAGEASEDESEHNPRRTKLGQSCGDVGQVPRVPRVLGKDLGVGFEYFLWFTPNLSWGRWTHFETSIFSSDGLVQPPTRISFVVKKEVRLQKTLWHGHCLKT